MTIPEMTADVEGRVAGQGAFAPPRIYRARPGWVSALGVTSIIVAVLSLVASGVTGVYGFGALLFVKMATGYASAAVYGSSGGAAPPAAVGPIATTTTPAPAAASAGGAPTGIASPTARRQIVVAVDAVQRLAASRQTQFDKLLAEAGNSLGFRLKPDGSPVNVRRDLVQSGRAPATQPADRDVDFLITPAGRIELADSTASFVSTDGTVGFQTSAGTDGVTPIASAWSLPAAEVQAVVDDVTAQAGGKLTPAQAQRLRASLQAPNQRLVAPGSAGMNWIHTSFDPNGVATIGINNNTLVLAPGGTVVSQGPTPLPVGLTAASPEAAALVAFEAGLSIGLAILLFVTGVLLLRQAPVAFRLLHVYAWLKLPLAVVGGVGLAWLWGSFTGAMATAPTDQDRTVANAWGIATAVAGLAFPIAVLAVLWSRGVREYLGEARRSV